MNKTDSISFPSVIRSEKNGGLMKMMNKECQDIQYLKCRVPITTSPYLQTSEYLSNYDLINWKYAGNSLKKVM